MKIGVISDTHIKKKISIINKIIDNYLTDVQIIFHVGDFNSIDAVNAIKDRKKFIGVFGNNDSKNVRNTLNEKEIVNLEGYKIGLFHGNGDKKINIEERAYNKFKNDKVDIIIFGHSHKPIIRTKNGVLMINPGSLTKKYKERWYSYVLLELNKKNIDAKISFIHSK